MGTITNVDGRYRAQVRITRGGKTFFSQARTFDRKPAVKAWIKKREAELSKPGVLEPKPKTVFEAIDRYVLESRKAMGKTKAQVLEPVRIVAQRIRLGLVAPALRGQQHRSADQRREIMVRY